MAENLTQKILKAHLVSGRWEAGEELSLRVDQALLQDATGTMACLEFLQLGIDRVRIPLAVQYVDHNMIQIDYKNPDDHRFLQSFCAKFGILFSRPGNGISHYVHCERFSKPGEILIGADSHTTTSGALGMIAIGAGGLEVAVTLAGVPFEIEAPKVVGVELSGALQPWVEAKDIILELLRRRGVRGGLGRIFEFYGPALETLSIPERMTICNMCAELGATTGIFSSDERTLEWLRYQKREQDWKPLAADEGASYDETERIVLDELEPLIAKPSSPGNVVPVREVAGTPAVQVCVGSSVNSGFEDLAIVAAVLENKILPPQLALTVTPGSRQILDIIARADIYRNLVMAGARMLEPSCGPCVGMGLAPPSRVASVRTFNRNFPGRSGTIDDQVYLCSPATAAATALKGVITDPRELAKQAPRLAPMPSNPAADDRHIMKPLPPEDAKKISLLVGPNIKPPPEQKRLPESIEGRVLIVVGDDVSTGDLSPDGAEVMAFRSNLPIMAQFVFRRIDPKFATRAMQWGGGFIVAGFNYGQGSSREHAALAPKTLGVRAVIAKSFARIHRRNLIAQGIVPLTFTDESDYERASQGDHWELPQLRTLIEKGERVVRAHVSESDAKLSLALKLSQRERQILVAGGLTRFIREGGAKSFGLSFGQSGAVDQGSPITSPVPQEQAS